MVNINAEPKPSYELTEEELDKATGGREGPRAPDQPDRDHTSGLLKASRWFQVCTDSEIIQRDKRHGRVGR